MRTAPLANNPNRSIVAFFQKDGHTFAVPIGTQSGGDVSIYADEMFFYEDPHQLFNFWKPEIWDAISRHEVQTGMNEWQVAFAVGMGTPQPGGDMSRKTVIYPNKGNPLTVTFENGKATNIQSGR